MGVDVTVMGAGIFGLSCAWSLTKRGAKVRVIDPNGPGAGASGGILGALSPHTPERWEPKKDFQLHSLLAAKSFWAEVADLSGQDPGYARLGRLQPIANARTLELARSRTPDAVQLWKGEAAWDVVNAEGTWAPVSPTGYLVHDTLSARIHPGRAVQALAAALKALGCEIRAQAETSGPVVWACGVEGLAMLSNDLGCEVGNAQKGQAALLDYSAPQSAQIFGDGIHVVPHADGTTAIGSTSERYYDDPFSPDQLLDDLVSRGRELVPAIRDAPILRKWAGLRPRSGTRAPMLGAWPGRPGHYVANGGFKIGFGMACGVGETMARLILDGDDRFPEEFRVEANLGS